MSDSPYLTSEWALEGTQDAAVFSEPTSERQDHVALLVTDGERRVFRNGLIDCCTRALRNLKDGGFFREGLGKESIPLPGAGTHPIAMGAPSLAAPPQRRVAGAARIRQDRFRCDGNRHAPPLQASSETLLVPVYALCLSVF